MFDYIITTVDVIETGDVEVGSPYGEGAKYVEFHGKISHRATDDDTAFLLDVREKEIKNDTVVFIAVKVSFETFRKRLLAENKKLLGCIHGFQQEPEKWIDVCAEIQRSPEFHHKVIPIIWPSVGKAGLDISIKYDREQAIAYQAGKALAPIAEIGKDLHLSLMAHSMGNRVLFSYVKYIASKGKKFEDVFMVAADVWDEVFNHRIITESWCQPPTNYINLWKDTGLKLCDMLKDGGKIHITHYSGDLALIASEYWENWRRRLGRFGHISQASLVHDQCVDKLHPFDLNPFSDEVKKDDSRFQHDYEKIPSLIKYYNKTMSADFNTNP